VWRSLVDPHAPGARPWLDLRPGEIEPTVIEAAEPHLVVWSTLWPDRPDDRIRFDLSPHQSDTMLTWTLLSPEMPDDATVGRLRHRLNFLINASLRHSYGQ
jgi:hypothetical protein